MAPPRRRTPTTTTATSATQNRKCKAEITIDTTMKMTSAASTIKMSCPMTSEYVTAAALWWLRPGVFAFPPAHQVSAGGQEQR